MAEIQLVIFDCDGVLMDSEAIATKAECSIYKKFGFEIDETTFSARFSGSASAEILKVLEQEFDRPVSASMLDEITAEVNKRCGENAPAVEGAHEMLDMFDQPRCICSNSPSNRLKQMLSRTGLYDRFRPYIFSAKDLDPPVSKPKPDIFLKALKEFNIDARHALIIEDSTHGIAGANAAGVRAIGFTGGSHTYPGHSDALIEAGAQTVINRLRDLPAIINALGEWNGLSDQ